MRQSAAEQFDALDRWGAMLRYISERIAPSLLAFRRRGNCRI
jgi:hypothetical protein